MSSVFFWFLFGSALIKADRQNEQFVSRTSLAFLVASLRQFVPFVGQIIGLFAVTFKWNSRFMGFWRVYLPINALNYSII